MSEKYLADFNSWIDQTAQLLRESRWHKVDVAHLIEEVEGLGKSERRGQHLNLPIGSINLISNFTELKYKAYPQKTMTLTLNLSLELEQYLLQEANHHGLSVEAMALQLLTNSIVLKQKQAETVNLLQSWIDDEDESEQQETGQYLIHALDDDRLSERKFFPLEMKGVTW